MKVRNSGVKYSLESQGATISYALSPYIRYISYTSDTFGVTFFSKNFSIFLLDQLFRGNKS